jgi:hypothetical protein
MYMYMQQMLINYKVSVSYSIKQAIIFKPVTDGKSRTANFDVEFSFTDFILL